MKKYIIASILAYSLSVHAEEREVDCENAMTTIEMNICSTREVEAVEKNLEQYLQKAIERYVGQDKVIEAIKKSQEQWAVYSKEHCTSVYEIWSGGTIRGVMYSSCMLSLTKQRTHTIWSSFLQYEDSTPPLLPEPK